MDLGLEGRRALVCASTQGLGRACAEALAQEGALVFINGRHEEKTRRAAEEVSSATGSQVIPIVADLATREGRAVLVDACPAPDILVTNNAGPPPGNFLERDEGAWLEALGENMVAQLMLIRAVLPAMIERKFGRIVNITSAMVTTPRPHMTLSSGSRAGLTAVAKGISLDVAKHNVTINNLLPERFDTARQEQMARVAMVRESIDYAEARRRQVASISASRLGDPREFGATCAFLCSQWSGFLTGQNIHLDGGSYPALI